MELDITWAVPPFGDRQTELLQADAIPSPNSGLVFESDQVADDGTDQQRRRKQNCNS